MPIYAFRRENTPSPTKPKLASSKVDGSGTACGAALQEIRRIFGLKGIAPAPSLTVSPQTSD